MKFSKSNNPSKRKRRSQKHSPEYIEQRKTEFYEMYAKAQTEEEKDLLIKTYNVSMNP